VGDKMTSILQNKRGQTLGITIISIIFIFIIGMASINFFFDDISDFRSNLDCASPADISDGAKLLCLVVDLSIPYWIYLIFAITIGAIAARMYL
jgi:hypothetical protein